MNLHRIKSIGKYTYGKDNIKIHWYLEDNWLEIGSFCSIAGELTIFLGGNHRIDWATTFPFGHAFGDKFTKFNGVGHPLTKGDIIIGNDVWIGNNVTIMSGVTIGDGSVIATNSHIVKDVEPYTVVGGNPSKVIKKRFEDETINKLLELKWWEFPDEIIDEISPLLCSEYFENHLPYLFSIKNEINN